MLGSQTYCKLERYKIKVKQNLNELFTIDSRAGYRVGGSDLTEPDLRVTRDNCGQNFALKPVIPNFPIRDY